MRAEEQRKSELAKAWAFNERPDLDSPNVQIIARTTPSTSVRILPEPHQMVVYVLISEDNQCEFYGWAAGNDFKQRRQNATINPGDFQRDEIPVVE